MLSWLVIAAVSLGLFVRLDNVNRKSLWVDEVFTYNRVQLPTVDRLLESLEGTALTPLYYLTLWLWGRVLGVSDTTLRLFPACLGVLTLLVTYLAWRPLIGKTAAGWALALLSLNAYHVWYSLDAKMYAAVGLFATLSCGSFLNIVLNSGRRSVWMILYGLSTACLPLVSYTGAAAVFVQIVFGVGLFVVRPENRRMIVKSWLALLLAMVPLILWLPFFWSAAKGDFEMGWIGPLSPSHVPGETVKLLGDFLLGYRPSFRDITGLSWSRWPDFVYLPLVLGVLGFLAYSLIGVCWPGRRGKDIAESSAREEVLIFAALWVTLPILLTVVYSLVAHPVWGVSRYLISSAMGLGLWIATALKQRTSERLSLVVLVLIIGANFGILWFDRTHDTREDWRGTAQSILAASEGVNAHDQAWADLPAQTRPQAQVVVCNWLGYDAVLGGGFGISTWELRHAGLMERALIESVDIELAIANHRDFFFFERGRPLPARHDKVPKLLEPALAEFRCRAIFSKTYYSTECLCPIPTRPLMVEVWLCSPRDQILPALPARSAISSHSTKAASKPIPRGGEIGRNLVPEQP